MIGASSIRLAGKGIVAAAAAALIGGCATPLEYTPDEAMVEKLGTDGAKSKLVEVLSKARQPHVSSVKVADDSVQYFWDQPSDPFFTTTFGNVTQIFFLNIERIEVYPNQNVFVVGPQGQSVHKILFWNPEDARVFADLMSSFRAVRMGKRPIPGQAPAPAAPAPKS